VSGCLIDVECTRKARQRHRLQSDGVHAGGYRDRVELGFGEFDEPIGVVAPIEVLLQADRGQHVRPARVVTVSERL
jgi:hypothetical protein